jgi:DNA polymerase-3 subunit delta'
MSFKELLGQAELRRALARELCDGTISHAVLLTGPAGSGKKAWGGALAQALLCSGRQGAEPCAECLSCRQFKSGNHPYFMELKPQGRWLKIEQIRAARSRFYLDGDIRVCLIHQAERMTAEACSSLLKTLEDPPPGLYLILLTEHPRRLFSTIVSRCRRFSLQPLSRPEILDILRQRGGHNVEKEALASRLCGGLPGPALELAEDPAFERRLQEAASLAHGLAFRPVSPRELLSRAAALAERKDLVSCLELVYLFYRDGLISLLCGGEALLVNPDHARYWTQGRPSSCLEQAMEVVDTALREILNTNANRRLVMEGMLITLQRRFVQCPG